MIDTSNFSKIGIIDFGGQYAHLIASRIRRLGIYTEIISNEESIEKYKEYSGLIFSGGPNSVYSENSPGIQNDIFQLNIHKNCMYYSFSSSVSIILENNFARNPATLLPH